ncbi:MAG: DNA polymerase II large subunit [Methanomassiliicoccales archaeon]
MMVHKVACSEQMEAYFERLLEDANECYGVAERARSLGRDPENFVEIPQAEDLASRVEKILAAWKVEGVAERIRELGREHNREEVSILVAKEVANMPASSKEESIEKAVRVGLAVLTEGILVAPLEGIAGVRIGRNSDGSDYVAVRFAGPIRSAGGTGQAMSVLIADVVRREHGIGRYLPTHGEVQRFNEEIPLYKQCQHLQYTPSNQEIEMVVKNCPVCVDGEGTEDTEITGYRDLPRIETNRVRGGACLVVAEGLCQKAPKIDKHVAKLGIDGWDFIEEFISLSSREEESEQRIYPEYKYLTDIVAGRPVLAHPSTKGGFRLRYGRGRTTGLAAIAMNPATLYAMDEFIAIGTQVKIERPGKAGAITPCNGIEGPILLLDNGDLVQVNTAREMLEVRDRVAEIVDLGEVLIPFGEFVENNHLLVPGAYSPEWYLAELREAGGPPEDWESPGLDRALEISREFAVPLHPRFNLFWSDLGMDDLLSLRSHLLDTGRWEEGKLRLVRDPGQKRTLEELGALHRVEGKELVLEGHARVLLMGLGISEDLEEVAPFQGEGALAAVSSALGVRVMPRAVTRIGGRMARPEKAKERKMRPPPHVLFPLGNYGGPQRLVKEALKNEKIDVEVGVRQCPECHRNTPMCVCDCGAHTSPSDVPNAQSLDLDSILDRAMERLNESEIPDIKGVQGMMSRNKTPEALEKGILRAKHGVYVFKDGTIRYDMTDLPLTHFRPREIGLSVEKARELGYVRDFRGNELTDDSQLCELKVQDFVPSVSCGDYLVQVAKFLDELLERHYDLEPFYRASNREDLIGQMGVGLAPHTSGGVLCRFIGFTSSKVGYGHPYFHAAKRRNCDGDEDSCILLLDALLNFSHTFLPDRRGGLMDAPLVLTTRLDPNEVDKEAHNMDLCTEYPLEFYRATMDYRHPKEVEDVMDLVGARIGSMLQFENLGFTIDTSDINEGPSDSAYKTLESMMEKMNSQLELARKIRAVDEEDVVHRVITRHFLPDLIGNLKSFSGQKLRCTKCGAKYRRIPLRGTCYCGHTLTLTVHEKSVKKYLEITKEIGERFGIPVYTQQRIELIEESINSLFENDKVKKCRLSDFM